MKRKAKKPKTERSAGALRSAKPSGARTDQEKYRANEKRFKDLLFSLPVGVYRTTPEGQIIAANPALVRMLGYKNEAELCRVDIKDLYVRAGDRAAHLKMLEKRQTRLSEFKLRRKDGKAIWGRDYPRAVKGKDGKIVFCDGILIDIGTEIKSAERLNAAMEKLARSQREREAMIKKLKEASITDELTGLFNRRGFFTIGREYISLAVRRKTKMFLLYMDMDGLKQINDTFGHHIGDQAILQLAEFINRTFRASDVKGRMGGDEFAVFPIDSSLDGAETALARMQNAIDEFNAAADKPFRFSISSGMAFFDPDHPATIEDLLMRADKLMYERKRSKNGLI
ncbi:MAG: sensor domain-containing diguanylate cyclase [Candidatus Aminicenantales bacterium]|jgi:diguanylate cyclase (GGDEF)-like protein/PAS domain S-box-containing protein